MLRKVKHWVWLGALVAACSIGKVDDTTGDGTDTATGSNQPSSGNSGNSDTSDGADGGIPFRIDPVGPMLTPTTSSGDCVEGATKTCGPTSVAGNCRLGKSTCVQGAWGACEGAVLPGPRDCSSTDDNDCDGRPDNTVDDTCRCGVGMSEPCGAHPGLDGHGHCAAGQRSCTLAADKLSSDWGECQGAVGPGAKDSCVLGDDSDCDGTPNGGCPCVEGNVIDCGPAANVGICVIGKATCHNNAYGACVGAVTAKPRNCGSDQDNDCNGAQDNDIDLACTCTVNETRPCSEHPGLDGNGACTAGVQTCVTGNNNTTSAFGACIGAVGPTARDCSSDLDNDCNGTPDSSDTACGCVIGSEQVCNTHPQDGVGNCHAGTQVCVAGTNGAANKFGTCTGAVGPAAKDACTAGDDANCNGTPNEGCPATP